MSAFCSCNAGQWSVASGIQDRVLVPIQAPASVPPTCMYLAITRA